MWILIGLIAGVVTLWLAGLMLGLVALGAAEKEKESKSDADVPTSPSVDRFLAG